MNRRMSNWAKTTDYIDENENFYLNGTTEHIRFIQVCLICIIFHKLSKNSFLLEK